jgi:hypothetical protein
LIIFGLVDKKIPIFVLQSIATILIANPIYDVVFKYMMEEDMDEKDKLIAELMAKINKK